MKNSDYVLRFAVIREDSTRNKTNSHSSFYILHFKDYFLLRLAANTT